MINIKKLLPILLLFYSLTSVAQGEYNASKLSGYLRDLIKECSISKTRSMPKKDKTVCTLLKLCNNVSITDITNRHYCQVLDSIGGIYFVQVPVSQLGNLSLNNNVSRIEAHEMYRPNMNEVPAYIGVDNVWQGINLPQAFTGKGVVSGIADIGFDFTHAMFQNPEGETRIIRFIDMDKKNDDGMYGIPYDRENLSVMNHSPRAINQTHGTHVSSLMTGSAVQGTKGVYSGIATESDIVLAEVGLNPSDSTHNGISTSANALLGIKRIFDYSDEIGQPCVVNLSMGGWHSILESMDLAEQVISAMTGPGHILVSSAGNNGQFYSTLTKTESTPKVTGGFWGYPSYDDGSAMSQVKSIKCVLLSSDSQDIQFDFFKRANRKTPRDSIIINTDSLDVLNGDSLVCTTTVNYGEATIKAHKLVDYSLLSFDNTYQFEITMNIDALPLWVYVHGLEVTISSSHSAVMFTNPELTPFDVSRRNNSDEIDRYRNCLSRMYTIGFPSESEDVIAVGALDTRTSSFYNTLARFSSQGPTWDNRIKPEVTAPGVAIRGAYNQFCNTFEQEKKKFYDTVYDNIGKTHYLIPYDGTSMSSPIVAGTIVLWLQAKPDLTASDIRDVFAHTCKQIDDERIDGYPNNMYGYGEIDAYAGLLYILGITDSNNNISMTQPTSARLKLVEGTLFVFDVSSGLPIEGEVVITIYTLDGKPIANSYISTLNVSTLPKGIYVVQINSKQQSYTGSTLIRI